MDLAFVNLKLLLLSAAVCLKLCGLISATGSQLTLFCMACLKGRMRELLAALLKTYCPLLGEPLKKKIRNYLCAVAIRFIDMSFFPVPQRAV